jgi:hypothetical protein
MGEPTQLQTDIKRVDDSAGSSSVRDDSLNGLVNVVYSGIQEAETANEPNPFIRTRFQPIDPETGKVIGSTAFGPTQITDGLASKFSKDKKFSPQSEQFYQEVMVPMYAKFRRHGGVAAGNEVRHPDYDPAFDYGGNGNFDVEKYGEAYEQFSKEIMLSELIRLKGDVQAFVQAWRDETPEEDPRYFETFGRVFNAAHGIRDIIQ